MLYLIIGILFAKLWVFAFPQPHGIYVKVTEQYTNEDKSVLILFWPLFIAALILTVIFNTLRFLCLVLISLLGALV